MWVLDELIVLVIDLIFEVSYFYEFDKVFFYEVLVIFNERFKEDGDLDFYVKDYVNFFCVFIEVVLIFVLFVIVSCGVFV